MSGRLAHWVQRPHARRVCTTPQQQQDNNSRSLDKGGPGSVQMQCPKVRRGADGGALTRSVRVRSLFSKLRSETTASCCERLFIPGRRHLEYACQACGRHCRCPLSLLRHGDVVRRRRAERRLCERHIAAHVCLCSARWHRCAGGLQFDRASICSYPFAPSCRARACGHLCRAHARRVTEEVRHRRDGASPTG